MPIYEYHCADCNRSFEAYVRAGAQETECPACHRGNIARELSVFAAARGTSGMTNGGDFSGSSGAMGGGGCCGGGCGCR
jgi:putative FmdB family regulatory protein